MLADLGWILVGAGLWHLACWAVRVVFRRTKPFDTSGRSGEYAVLGSLRRARTTLFNLWVGWSLVGIGLVFVGHESGNDVLTDAAGYSTLALLVLHSLLDGRRQRKLEALLRERRSAEAGQAPPADC